MREILSADCREVEARSATAHFERHEAGGGLAGRFSDDHNTSFARPRFQGSLFGIDIRPGFLK
jgi:hypothetical protein